MSMPARNCTRDEGGPFEAGSQVLASNRCKPLWSRAMVVSVAVNAGTRFRRVRLREASASEPSMKCRKRIRRCQNRGVTLPPGSARGNPEACPSGIRHVGGAKLNQALVRNVRTCAPMQRERLQAAPNREDQSTNAERRGGAVHSRDEGSKRVKANQGSAGVDKQSIAGFEADLSNNLYKLWNRMCSGSYFPPPVRRVDIPKAGGGTRPLGIPTRRA